MRPVALAAVLLLPAAAAAQTIQGRVLDDREESPVQGATVTLADTTGQVLRRTYTDVNGSFWLWSTAVGLHHLSVEALGYASVDGRPVRLDSARVVQAELRLRPDAVPLEPLRVMARRDVERFTPDEFYDRMSRLADRGSFITRDEIEASGVRSVSEVIGRAPGTSVRPRGESVFTHTVYLLSYGRECRPVVFLDGRPLPEGNIDDWVGIDGIEGIEVYRGGFVPDTYTRDADNLECGVILIWRRADAQERFTPSWDRTLLFGVLGAVLLGATLLF